MSKNLTSGLIALILGAIYLATAMQLPDVKAGDAIGPRLFPVIVACAVMLAGAGLCIGDKLSAKKEPVNWNFVQDAGVWIKIAATMVLGVVYGMVLDSWGYLLATSLFMLCATSMINRGRFVQNVLISLLFPAVTYGAFAIALQLSLPRGIIENMLPF